MWYRTCHCEITVFIVYFQLSSSSRKMLQISHIVVVVGLLISCISAEYLNFNFNPSAPEHVRAHIFTFGNGSVPIAEGPNPFANNALDGVEFFSLHQGWVEEEISLRRKVCLLFHYLYAYFYSSQSIFSNTLAVACL